MQHAVQEAKVLAGNIVAFGRGGRLKSYRYADRGSVNHFMACWTAAVRAGTGSQPSWDQMILPDAETRANQGWSCTP